MTAGFFSGAVVRGLAGRVLLFLSLALLPLGLITVVQTRQIADQSRAKAELSLLGVTESLTAAKESVLLEAFGAAEALASVVRLRRHDDRICSDFLKEYAEASGAYSVVGFIPSDGIMKCSSRPSEIDFSQNATFLAAMQSGGRHATTIEEGKVSNKQVTVINTPVFENAEIIGVMAISIPYSTFEEIEVPKLSLMPIATLTFNQRGEMLTADRDFEEIIAELPKDVALAGRVDNKSSVFLGLNRENKLRSYAVLPLVPDAIYAISVWPGDTPFLRTNFLSRVLALLPVLMWLACLIVAFLALNRLAIVHIRKLGSQMRRFALNRTLPRDMLASNVPIELIEMERNFIEMAESIIQDEAAEEDNLREKNILLKEVHHRVKNNLQLISSIMNMQIRQAKGDDAKFVLRRLQERILSLATVHENLYKNDNLARVDASILLQDTVNQLLVVGLVPGSNTKVAQHYDKVTLDPDAAAPLTLLVSEAVTNALKYVSAAPGQVGHISVEMRRSAPEVATLVVENSAFGTPVEEGTGLGSKLILAFARQLNGQVDVDETDDQYRMTITFPVPEASKPIRDY